MLIVNKKDSYINNLSKRQIPLIKQGKLYFNTLKLIYNFYHIIISKREEEYRIWERQDLNLRRVAPRDLQSLAIDHSATRPFLFENTYFNNYIETASNGTRTRTSRAEVCYATPTTSCSHFRCKYILFLVSIRGCYNELLL